MRRIAAIALVGALGALWLLGTASSDGAGHPYQVTAIFDNAGFAVPGEDVRIAGAPVGSIKSVDLWNRTQAAVTIEIDNAGFTPFHADGHCAIRPQSLIAERYLDCLPGNSSAPALNRIARGVGAGSYLLPVTQTSSPIDSDIVQNIYQEPIRQRFALLLNELGTALAARGSDLNAVIHRADPALGYTDRVLQILAGENRTLANLARDSDAVLGPLAAVKRQLADFVVQANTTSVASASRAADISRSIQLFPPFLRQLRPLMVALANLADQGTPLLSSLGQSASALGREFQNLIPFAQAARPSLIALGNSSAASQPALVATIPLARRLLSLGGQAVPTAQLLDRLTSSLDRTGAIEQLMALLFNGTEAGNAFDAFGHYVRDELNVGACSSYYITPTAGCAATFGAVTGVAADRARRGLASGARTVSPIARRTASTIARRTISPIARRAVSQTNSRPGSEQMLSSLLSFLIAPK